MSFCGDGQGSHALLVGCSLGRFADLSAVNCTCGTMYTHCSRIYEPSQYLALSSFLIIRDLETMSHFLLKESDSPRSVLTQISTSPQPLV